MNAVFPDASYPRRFDLYLRKDMLFDVVDFQTVLIPALDIDVSSG